MTWYLSNVWILETCLLDKCLLEKAETKRRYQNVNIDRFNNIKFVAVP